MTITKRLQRYCFFLICANLFFYFFLHMSIFLRTFAPDLDIKTY